MSRHVSAAEATAALVRTTWNPCVWVMGLMLCLPRVAAANVNDAPPDDDASEGSANPEVTSASDEKPEDWTPPDPTLPAVERAKQWWLRAQVLGQAGQLRESAVAYRQSYDAKPTLAALYNVALALDLSGQPLQAIAAYERYLGEDGVDGDETSAVLDRISELDGEVGTIVVAGPAGADVLFEIDGEVVLPTPEGVRVLPGPHDIAFVRDGVRQSRRVVLKAGMREVVAFSPETEPDRRLQAEGPVDVVDGEDGPESRGVDGARRQSLRVGAWVSLGGTVATGLALLGTGLGALQAKREFEDASCGGPCPDGTVYDPSIESKFLRLRTASNVLIAVASVGAVTTTALLIAGWSSAGDAKLQGANAGLFRPRALRAPRVSFDVHGVHF